MTKRFSKRRDGVGLLIGIGKVVDEILNYKAEYSDQAKLHFSTQVCALVAAYVSPLDLRTEISQHSQLNSWNRFQVQGACICVAAWMGDEDMFHHFANECPTFADNSTTCFGSAWWAAAYNAHLPLLNHMRLSRFNIWNTNGGWLGNLTPMQAACRNTNEVHQRAACIILQTFKDLLQYRPLDMTVVTDFAVQTGNRELVELLTRQCYLERLEEHLGKAVSDLCRTGTDKPLIAFLLSRGADPNAVKFLTENPANPPLNSPLLDAVERQNMDLVRLLLDHGAHPDHLGHMDVCSLSVAIKQNNLELINLLLSNGASPALYWADSTSDYCALEESFTLGHFEALSAVLNYCNLTHDAEADIWAYKVLLLAAKHGKTDIIRLLASAGCSIHPRYGPPIRGPPESPPRSRKLASRPRIRLQILRPAIDIAMENGHLQAAQLLHSLGAKMSYAKEEVEDEDGEWKPAGSAVGVPDHWEERRLTRTAKKKADELPRDWRSTHSRLRDERGTQQPRATGLGLGTRLSRRWWRPQVQRGLWSREIKSSPPDVEEEE